MHARETIEDDAQAIALSALAWTLGDDRRADRLLALTGLDAGDMRTRLTDPALLDAVLGFLESHEPDLVACAETLGIKPERLIAARARLVQ
jgi:Protein of unknown function (DUF3572)